MRPMIERGQTMRLVVAALLAVAALPAVVFVQSDADRRASHRRPVPGGDLSFSRYSTLGQISRSNIKSLGGAWTVELGAKSQVGDGRPGRRDVHTQRVLALDARTGKTLWAQTERAVQRQRRGVTVAEDCAGGPVRVSVIALRADWRSRVDVKVRMWRRATDTFRHRRLSETAWRSFPCPAVTAISADDHRSRHENRQGAVDVLRRSRAGRGRSRTWPADSDVWRYGGAPSG
jgi:hypothetical protein